MKKLIIFLLVIILFIIGFGKYNQYKRYHSPEVNYKTDKKLDLEYYNQDLVLNYYEAVEELDSYIMLEWSAKDIDVRAPENDDIQTKTTYFVPNGETGMHPHREIDVISFMVKGRVLHEGTLEHGKMLNESEIQVQRGGGKGFFHNEINPDSTENRMVQIWCIPEISEQNPAYKKYALKVSIRPTPSCTYLQTALSLCHH